ncbi:MAG: hypothetical protein ACRDRU_01800 [Pseudonocardiaceae bacterium]
MTQVMGSSVLVSADSKISYRVWPDDDMIHFIFGGHDELDMDMNEDDLRRCIATFTEALAAFEAAAASQPDGTVAADPVS